MNLYLVGQQPKCSAAFTDASGSPVDPSGVTATWKDPDGVETTYTYPTSPELVKVSAGLYYFYINATKPGRYFYRFAGTGVNQDAVETHFEVRASNL